MRPASSFKGLTIAAADGDIGSVKDLYFDDGSWTVRYLVVDTGAWLPGRQVLISPMSVNQPVTLDRVFVDLTREQVKDSPPVESDLPVNRQNELELSRHYRYPYYWEGPLRWGAVDF